MSRVTEANIMGGPAVTTSKESESVGVMGEWYVRRLAMRAMQRNQSPAPEAVIDV